MEALGRHCCCMDSREPSHQIVDDDDQCWKRKEMDPIGFDF